MLFRSKTSSGRWLADQTMAWFTRWLGRTRLAFRKMVACGRRSEEHTSELQSHSDLLSFPTRCSSDLKLRVEDGWQIRRWHGLRVGLVEQDWPSARWWPVDGDRKSTRLNSSHTVISSLSLHDALPI